MQALIRYAGLGLLVFVAAACGGKGDGSGDSGSGGSGASGGSGGSGGTSSASGGDAGETGSSGGTGGSASGVTTSYTFDSNAEGWGALYTSSYEVPATGQGGAGGEGGASSDMVLPDPVDLAEVTVDWTDEDGDPDAGALAASIPFDSAGQTVGIGLVLGEPGVDFTGKLFVARVKLVSGFGDPSDLMMNPGGVKLYVKTLPGYVYANGPYFNLGDMTNPTGEWITITFDMEQAPTYVDTSNPDGEYTPTAVAEIGLEFYTGSNTTTATTAEVLIDTISF